jgi:hypothetical protein
VCKERRVNGISFSLNNAEPPAGEAPSTNRVTG